MKNRFILLIFSFTLLSILNARELKNNYSLKIDSIQQLLNSQLKEDTIKIRRLYDLALICFYDRQYQRGLIAAKQARQLSKDLHYLPGEGLYFNSMMLFQKGKIANYYYIEKNWLFPDRMKKKETNILEEITPPKTDPVKENEQLYPALNYFEKLQDKETMANILAAIAENYFQLNKYNESLLAADQAIKLFKDLGQKAPAFCLLLTKIAVLEKMGQLKEANEAEVETRQMIDQSVQIREIGQLSHILSRKYLEENKIALAVEYGLKADQALEQMDEKQLRPQTLINLGISYNVVLLNKKAIEYLIKASELQKETPSILGAGLEWTYNKIAFTLIELREYDEANGYIKKAKEIIDTLDDSFEKHFDLAQHFDAAGQVLMSQEKYVEALPYFFKAINVTDTFQLPAGLASYFNYYIAQCYQKLGNLNQSINYVAKSFDFASKDNSLDGRRVRLKSSLLLSELYDQLRQPLEAYKYLTIYTNLKKEIEEADAANSLANIEIQGVLEKSEKEKNQLEKATLLKEQENQNQRWWLISIAGALFTAVCLMFILYRNNRQKQKVNSVLEEQNKVIEHTLNNLKSTQAQLIQSEKMASLGELTAGIAHEIQNPLNFVNNFSELNGELVNELSSELAIGNEQLAIGNWQQVKELIHDIKENSEKINHHGKRAESIVKGMLEHSRTSTGIKEPTDINKLCDEFIRLSYHGLRAKDPRFNCDYKLDLDPNMPLVNVVSQDIGRVLLNIINNSFQACAERSLGTVNEKQQILNKRSDAVKSQSSYDQEFDSPSGGGGKEGINILVLPPAPKARPDELVGRGEQTSVYQPLVSIKTSYVPKGTSASLRLPTGEAGRCEISISDNGPGIPTHIKDKIFQPFFTTKPTGQGTGLGLSLAYDIIKAHGGEIKVVSNENAQGTVFIIQLPIL